MSSCADYVVSLTLSTAPLIIHVLCRLTCLEADERTVLGKVHEEQGLIHGTLALPLQEPASCLHCEDQRRATKSGRPIPERIAQDHRLPMIITESGQCSSVCEMKSWLITQ
jgi:hypothetical protein